MLTIDQLKVGSFYVDKTTNDVVEFLEFPVSSKKFVAFMHPTSRSTSMPTKLFLEHFDLYDPEKKSKEIEILNGWAEVETSKRLDYNVNVSPRVSIISSNLIVLNRAFLKKYAQDRKICCVVRKENELGLIFFPNLTNSIGKNVFELKQHPGNTMRINCARIVKTLREEAKRLGNVFIKSVIKFTTENYDDKATGLKYKIIKFKFMNK